VYSAGKQQTVHTIQLISAAAAGRSGHNYNSIYAHFKQSVPPSQHMQTASITHKNAYIL